MKKLSSLLQSSTFILSAVFFLAPTTPVSATVASYVTVEFDAIYNVAVEHNADNKSIYFIYGKNTVTDKEVKVAFLADGRDANTCFNFAVASTDWSARYLSVRGAYSNVRLKPAQAGYTGIANITCAVNASKRGGIIGNPGNPQNPGTVDGGGNSNGGGGTTDSHPLTNTATGTAH